ncbi:MAG: SEC-C domain-containing protein [Nitrospirae bacterium]|nr:SEC-C domain-containing protein [Nitrospirota bacterium]
MVTKAIENAQKRVEAHNFDIRKHLLEYDDVMNKQRQEIYSFRREALQSESLKERVIDMMEDETDELLSVYCPDAAEWDINGLKDALYGRFAVDLKLDGFSSVDDLRDFIVSQARGSYDKKEVEAGAEFMRYIEKMVLLQVIDAQWKDHLLGIDHVKEGIGLRGYAQRDPLVEYKKEAFDLFAEMSGRLTSEVLMRLFKIQVRHEEEQEIKMKSEQNLVYNRAGGDSAHQPVHKEKKVGRNDPCPCGSGKKYKKCCGASA